MTELKGTVVAGTGVAEADETAGTEEAEVPGAAAGLDETGAV